MRIWIKIPLPDGYLILMDNDQEFYCTLGGMHKNEIWKMTKQLKIHFKEHGIKVKVRRTDSYLYLKGKTPEDHAMLIIHYAT